MGRLSSSAPAITCASNLTIVRSPLNGTIEIAGPERVRLGELVGQFLTATKDTRKVIADAHALYFGVELDGRSLVPGNNPRIGATRFSDWLSHSGATLRAGPRA